MKKFMLLACFGVLVSIIACKTNTESNHTHTHEDGSTHADHDTTKHHQESFSLTDTSKTDSIHVHKGGEKHSH